MTYNDVDWKRVLIDQMIFHWDSMLMPRLQGLTDGEYFWEPVANCWTIHRQEDGTYLMDQATYPDPVPPPFTTLAWRMNHLINVFGQRFSNHFGDGSYSTPDALAPATADAAIAELTHQHDLWQNALLALDPEEFARPCGPAEHRYSEEPLATLVQHINRELIHHGGEICLLRDLYRYRSTLRA